MDLSRAEKFAEEVIAGVWEDTLPGTAFWRLGQVFKAELERDSESKIFNEQFADGVSVYRYKLQSSRQRWSKMMWAGEILLIFLLFGYTFPLELPYVGSLLTGQVPRGLLELVFLAFLIAQLKVFEFRNKIRLCENLLRTYVDVRYPQETRDFYLLRWGIDDLTFKLHDKEYMGYKRKKEGMLFFRIVKILTLMVGLFFNAVSHLLIVLSIIKVFSQPSFGVGSYAVVVGVTIYFIHSMRHSMVGTFPLLYEKRRT